VVLTLVTPVVGHLSDRMGRLKIMTASAIAYAITIIPGFLMLNNYPGTASLILLMTWLGFLKATYFGALPALMSESFPPRTRATGLALSYNIGTTVFGGFTPVIIAGLIALTHSAFAPGIYLVISAVISLFAIAMMRSRLGLR